jgi:hypothetical protein
MGTLGQAAVLLHDQLALRSLHQDLEGVVAELGGQDAVGGRGRAASLDVAEDRGAHVEPGQLFDVGNQLVGDAAQANRIGAGFHPALR